jgi:hypothetical protein
MLFVTKTKGEFDKVGNMHAYPSIGFNHTFRKNISTPLRIKETPIWQCVWGRFLQLINHSTVKRIVYH